MDNKINIETFEKLFNWTKDKETKYYIKSIIDILNAKQTN